MLRLRLKIMTVVLALALAGSGIALVQAKTGVDTVPMADSLRVTPAPAPAAPTLEAALLAQAPALDPDVLDLALRARESAALKGLLKDRRTLTVIDYSRPSVVPRFWVFDLVARKLLFEERVAHGRNSGDIMATRFSNAESSLETSLGLFVTRDVYVGAHGKSLRLEGLEPGFNDRALARAIVIHGADYVSPAAVRALGFLGRSFGCPALSRQIAPRVIERLRGGSPVFAFFPDAHWLASSRFLQPSPTVATTLAVELE